MLAERQRATRLWHLGVHWISNANKSKELEIVLCGRHGCQRNRASAMGERQHAQACMGEALHFRKRFGTSPFVEGNGLRTVAHSNTKG
jgi:hypothetical protein